MTNKNEENSLLPNKLAEKSHGNVSYAKQKYVMHAAISEKASNCENLDESQGICESNSSSSSSNCSPVKYQNKLINYKKNTYNLEER